MTILEVETQVMDKDFNVPLVDLNDVRFFCGQSHPELATGIVKYLGVPLEKTYFAKYSNDNLHIQLGASVRGRAVYIVQSLVPPVSDHLLELLMMMDIARGAGAREVHAIIPYFSYARSDKKDAPRISITARLVADLLQTSGATHVMTMTLHSPQVHGFFSIPTDPLTARPLFVRYFRGKNLDPNKVLVVAPDIGHAKPAARFASRLGLPIAAAEKTRLSDTEVSISRSINRLVYGYNKAIIYDDEIVTGGSVIGLSKLLIDAGIIEIATVCTHGLFAGDAFERIAAVPEITEIITTDTIPIPAALRPQNMTILSVAQIFAEAIQRNYNRQSIGDLFAFSDQEDDDG